MGRLLLGFSLLITLNLESLHAQNAPAHPDLIDMSLEDLMKIKTDSVYGASGYKQKVTEAPASIAIVTADKTGTGCGSRSTWMPPRKRG